MEKMREMRTTAQISDLSSVGRYHGRQSDPSWDKKNGKHTQVWNTDEEIGNHESGSTIQAIRSFLDECSAILEKSRNIRDSHEGHECGAEELAIVSAGISPLPIGTTHNSISERSDR